jgi:hypothetical protein
LEVIAELMTKADRRGSLFAWKRIRVDAELLDRAGILPFLRSLPLLRRLKSVC